MKVDQTKLSPFTNHSSSNVFTSTKNRVEMVVPQPKQQFSYTLLPTVLPMNTQASNKPTMYAISLPGSPLQTTFLPRSSPLQKNVLLQVLPNTSLRYIITPGQVQPKSHENSSKDAKPQVLNITPMNSNNVSSSAKSTVLNPPATKRLPSTLVSNTKKYSKSTKTFSTTNKYLNPSLVSDNEITKKSNENSSKDAKPQILNINPMNSNNVSSSAKSTVFIPPATKSLPSTLVSNTKKYSKSAKTFSTTNKYLNPSLEITKKPVNDLLCFVCNITCDSVELLQQHKEGIEFYCRVCAQKFNDHAELESHSENHKPVSCKICQTQFYTSTDRLQHKRTSKECNKQVECKICTKWFINKRSLAAHKRVVHREKTRSVVFFKCIVCLKSYDNSQSLATHLEDVHIAYEDMECQTCQKLVRGPKKMKHHVQSVHFTPVTDDSNSLTCPVCKKVFIKAVNLASHLRIHDETEKLCEICGKSIKERLMKSHMHIEHPKTGIFTCKSCNETFDTFYKRKMHTKTHFTKPNPVYCEICGKKYQSDTILRNHIRIHSGEKPFKCDTCGASFRQKASLNTHQRVHSTVGKYKCTGCGMTFKWLQTFNKHMKKCELFEEDNI